MTLDEVREQGLGAAIENSEDELCSMEEVEAYVNMTHVALFSGSFDPPTVGHIAFVRFLLEDFDEVWVVPCPTHAFGKNMLPVSTRLEMCNIAFGDIVKVMICDHEISQGLSGAAIDFVTSLLSDPIAADRTFHYAIGMDNAHNIHRWVEFQKLLGLIPFVVVPREGEEIDVTIDWYENSPHKLLVPSSPLPLTSSTEVREIIRTKGDSDRLSQLTTTPILAYLRDRSLYVS